MYLLSLSDNLFSAYIMLMLFADFLFCSFNCYVIVIVMPTCILLSVIVKQFPLQLFPSTIYVPLTLLISYHCSCKSHIFYHSYHIILVYITHIKLYCHSHYHCPFSHVYTAYYNYNARIVPIFLFL